ncbi:D-isomer specific 2-hydroxyacid dehydrogenase [Tricharina praecox]|uniref:D-isomer specific 2-hydroxyacid dehydrogenase n=1 Tax=Tricharina praecox TaxID=43433 RepID=UPI00221EF3DF|nr:D-isomer specific 2-hydroxyacid dehydrogenase [Tricharina praecox]KAI5842823.1 D-isomer specific 2-hydroxyacid dehydrogenase [Tricharina praecox]
MTRPAALLLGRIDHARPEWEALSDIAELQEFSSGTLTTFHAALLAGAYSNVVAIYRTFDSGVSLTGPFSRELISVLPPSVKFICHNGAGYDQIDVAACSARGIAVSHTPAAVDAATANVAMMLLLGALRRSWIPESALRMGRWKGEMQLGRDPEGKTLGILGMGGIGSAVARRAKGFEMRVVYHNRRPAREDNGAEYIASLDEFWGLCDIISIHLPLSTTTKHFITHAQFSLMKRGVVIVNTARGAIIDEEALVQALESGQVGSAGLDVFENEPEIHPALIGNANVVLLPHIGTATVETQRKMECLVVSNVRSALEKGTLVTQVPEQREGGQFPVL